MYVYMYVCMYVYISIMYIYMQECMHAHMVAEWTPAFLKVTGKGVVGVGRRWR